MVGLLFKQQQPIGSVHDTTQELRPSLHLLYCCRPTEQR